MTDTNPSAPVTPEALAEMQALIEHGRRRSSGRERRLADLAQTLAEQNTKLHERAESAEVDRDVLDGMLSEAWSGSRDDADKITQLESLARTAYEAGASAWKARAELAEKAIEDALHSPGCPWYQTWRGLSCNCWKARYEAAKAALDV